MDLGKIVRNTALALSTLAATTASAGELKYYGFSGAANTQQSIQETSGHTNLYLMNVNDPRLRDIDWVKSGVASGIGVILAAHDKLYKLVEATLNGEPLNLKQFENYTREDFSSLKEKDGYMFDFELRDDYVQRWEAATQDIDYAMKLLVEMVYLADESCWLQITRDELLAGHNLIKSKNPEIETVTSFCHMVTEQCLEGLPLVTDKWGYHQYALRDPATDPEYQANFTMLQSHGGDKDIFLVFDAFNSPRHRLEGIFPEDMDGITWKFYEFALNTLHVIGMMGFDYNSGDAWTGARDFPDNVQEVYKIMGSEITGKCLAPEGVKPQHALFFDECSLYAVLRYLDGNQIKQGDIMPRQSDYGTWVDQNGNLLAGLHLKGEAPFLPYASSYDDNKKRIDVYNTQTGERVWFDGDQILRTPHTMPHSQEEE